MEQAALTPLPLSIDPKFTEMSLCSTSLKRFWSRGGRDKLKPTRRTLKVDPS